LKPKLSTLAGGSGARFLQLGGQYIAIDAITSFFPSPRDKDHASIICLSDGRSIEVGVTVEELRVRLAGWEEK